MKGLPLQSPLRRDKAPWRVVLKALGDGRADRLARTKRRCDALCEQTTIRLGHQILFGRGE